MPAIPEMRVSAVIVQEKVDDKTLSSSTVAEWQFMSKMHEA